MLTWGYLGKCPNCPLGLANEGPTWSQHIPQPGSMLENQTCTEGHFASDAFVPCESENTDVPRPAPKVLWKTESLSVPGTTF